MACGPRLDGCHRLGEPFDLRKTQCRVFADNRKFASIVDASADSALLQARIERDIEAAGLLQTLIFGVVIEGASYFQFADKWIGTPMDFAAALFWGFGTDVGADAALRLPRPSRNLASTYGPRRSERRNGRLRHPWVGLVDDQNRGGKAVQLGTE